MTRTMDPFFAKEQKLIRVLYRRVSNAGEVKKLILTSRLPLCILKPNLIVDEFQLSVAISKARHNENEHLMTGKTFPVELIYCLSPTKNITDSLRKFGTEEGDMDLIIVGEEGHYQTIKNSIQGDLADMGEMRQLTDVNQVMELYQITPEELGVSSLLDSVITRMSTKEYQL